MAAPPSVGLAYGFLGSNLGDVAITKGALALLRASGVRGTIRVIGRSLNTKLTRTSWKRVTASDDDIVFHGWDHTFSSLRGETPPSLELFRMLLQTPQARASILDAAGLKGADSVYYSGGENLFSWGTANDDWNMFGRLAPILAAQREGLNTGFLPCTFGPFQSEASRRLIDWALSSADFVMARDLRSPALLPTPLSLQTGADCAFFTPDVAGSASAPTRWNKRIALVPRLEGAGLRLGPDRSQAYLATLAEQGIEESSAFQLYLEIGRRLLSGGRYVRILTQCDADVALNRALYEALKPHAIADNQVNLTRPANLMAYHRVLASCGGVVTSRLHTAIFAMQNDVTPIGLYYDTHGHKTPGVFEMFGLDEFCLAASEFNPDQLFPMLAKSRAASAGLRATLDGVRERTIEIVRRGRGFEDDIAKTQDDPAVLGQQATQNA